MNNSPLVLIVGSVYAFVRKSLNHKQQTLLPLSNLRTTGDPPPNRGDLVVRDITLLVEPLLGMVGQLGTGNIT
ncbi:hypothetical protein Hanom_Chr06g00565291 [Helianthus anomalus]